MPRRVPDTDPRSDAARRSSISTTGIGAKESFSKSSAAELPETGFGGAKLDNRKVIGVRLNLHSLNDALHQTAAGTPARLQIREGLDSEMPKVLRKVLDLEYTARRHPERAILARNEQHVARIREIYRVLREGSGERRNDGPKQAHVDFIDVDPLDKQTIVGKVPAQAAVEFLGEQRSDPRYPWIRRLGDDEVVRASVARKKDLASSMMMRLRGSM